MAGVREELTLTELVAWAGRTAERMDQLDFTVPLKQTAVILAGAAKDCFAGGHDPDGVPWVPLARPRAQGGAVPLRNNGILMASLTGQAPGHVEIIAGASLEWGTNVSYAAIHNYGGTIHVPEQRRDRPWVFVAASGATVFTRKIAAHDVIVPQRQFVGVGAETAQDIGSVFGEWFLGQVA